MGIVRALVPRAVTTATVAVAAVYPHYLGIVCAPVPSTVASAGVATTTTSCHALNGTRSGHAKPY